ncbi:MAG: cache domain-containing protein [Candidatus Cloacimonetes bacterium]|nr:cache domain-containing protein [Candidatus Cloacimonadota bacterium]
MRIVSAKLLLIFITIIFLAQFGCRDSSGQYEEIARYVVHTTATGLAAVLAEMETEEEQIEFLRRFITPIRFYPDETGYFYIYNYDCINIAHATQKDLEGKDLSQYQDEQGKLVIQELSKVSRTGGGFVDYFWQKPDDEAEYRKLGYVEPIPGTDYFIGTGVYLQ